MSTDIDQFGHLLSHATCSGHLSAAHAGNRQRMPGQLAGMKIAARGMGGRHIGQE
jgi:hypothetical protein